MSTKKAPLKSTLYSIPVLLVTVLFLWNTNNSINKTEKDPVTKAATAATNIQYFDLQNFPILRISRDSITALFAQNTGEPRVHKLVFKFEVDRTKSYPWLAVFRARKNGRKYISPDTYAIIKPTPKEETCEILNVYTLGNLELARKVSGNSDDISWEKILKKATDTDTHLYFYPRKEGNGVTYVLAWGRDTPKSCADANKINFVENGLNPSPPADPK